MQTLAKVMPRNSGRLVVVMRHPETGQFFEAPYEIRKEEGHGLHIWRYAHNDDDLSYYCTVSNAHEAEQIITELATGARK